MKVIIIISFNERPVRTYVPGYQHSVVEHWASSHSDCVLALWVKYTDTVSSKTVVFWRKRNNKTWGANLQKKKEVKTRPCSSCGAGTTQKRTSGSWLPPCWRGASVWAWLWSTGCSTPWAATTAPTGWAPVSVTTRRGTNGRPWPPWRHCALELVREIWTPPPPPPQHTPTHTH